MISKSEELRMTLKTMNIINGRELAEYCDADAVIFFVDRRKDQDGNPDPRAELVYPGHQDEKVEYFRPEPNDHGIGQKRRTCLFKAQKVAEEKFGIEHWSRSPFSNCWLPSEVVSRIHEEFGQTG